MGSEMNVETVANGGEPVGNEASTPSRIEELEKQLRAAEGLLDVAKNTVESLRKENTDLEEMRLNLGHTVAELEEGVRNGIAIADELVLERARTDALIATFTKCDICRRPATMIVTGGAICDTPHGYTGPIPRDVVEIPCAKELRAILAARAAMEAAEAADGEEPPAAEQQPLAAPPGTSAHDDGEAGEPVSRCEKTGVECGSEAWTTQPVCLCAQCERWRKRPRSEPAPELEWKTTVKAGRG